MKKSFYEVLDAATIDIMRHGFTSQELIDSWVDKLRTAMKESMVPQHLLDIALKRTLGGVFSKLVDKGGLAKHHKVERFTIERINYKLRPELEKRILASSQLIKFNRNKMVEETLQRFSGWCTSIPEGGSDVETKREVLAPIKAPFHSLPFLERRVIIDQSHKLISSINEIVAIDQDAIAAEWHSHYKQAGYNYRPDHKERDNRVYMLRGNWASEKGFMKVGPAGYIDDITRPGEEVYCRCFYRYIYNIRDLPKDMLTEKGREALSGGGKS